jgi:DNA polymerase
VSERGGSRSRGRAPRAARQRRLDHAREESGRCRRCELWARGTQTVFGEGAANAKHFNWEPRGKRRLHMKPNLAHVLACHFWLEEEIAAVSPRVIVALGATAARAVLGPGARVLRDRGRWLPSPLAPSVTVTVHPSSLLRAPTPEARQDARRAFVDDLRQVARRLKGEE